MNDAALVYKEKREFVEDKLVPLLQAIDTRIETAEYHTLSRSPYDLEYVLITWLGGSDKRVYVTGDSLLALSRDVLGAIS